MPTSRSGTITVVAVVVLVATAPVLWGIADVREAQAVDRKQSELADSTVPTRQAPNDYDGDGIRDTPDQCPTRPETTNGFRDGDGCPDVVETTGAS
ncbi:hypothetical protein [Natrinema versiforme]|uniref:Thrombospondin type 3 repeat-containing protein n=1 Tax=Natrinema versiforme JCM 10478 TaxID=1227496 RepID=L9Y059_9EURY|nr:hypothetical protein [Natrinema versiforme]ELY67430.1 hypothetical protein C489_10079 [Natrinema versiforme JCM 10478]